MNKNVTASGIFSLNRKKAFCIFILWILAAAMFTPTALAQADDPDPLVRALYFFSEEVKRDTANTGLKTVMLIYTDYPALTEYIINTIKTNITRGRNYIFINSAEHGIVPDKPLSIDEAKEIGKSLGADLVIRANVSPIQGKAHISLRYHDFTRNKSEGGMYDISASKIRVSMLVGSQTNTAKTAKTEAGDDEAPAKFTFHITYTGASNDIDEIRDEKIPMDYFTTSQQALSLDMGLNLFKYLNLVLDFGIKDFNFAGKNVKFTDIINLGGKIGFKWASIVIDYRFINGDVEFPSKKETKAESVAGIIPNQPYIDYGRQFGRVESRTVALMFSTSNIFNLGIIWNNATGASMIQNKYFDPHIQTDTFGVRAHLRMDHFNKFWDDDWVVDASKNIYWSFIANLYVDLAFGKATLSADVEKAIKNDNIIKFKDIDLDVMYNGVRGMLGIHFVQELSNNRYIEIIGLGLDINGGGTTAADMGFGSTVIGAFVRIGFAL